jgi:hypothetical protein
MSAERLSHVHERPSPLAIIRTSMHGSGSRGENNVRMAYVFFSITSIKCGGGDRKKNHAVLIERLNTCCVERSRAHVTWYDDRRIESRHSHHDTGDKGTNSHRRQS